MQYLLAVPVAVACVFASAQPVQRARDLRQALEQYHPASAPRSQPRQLTPEESAQLRRQLADFKQSAATSPPQEGSTSR